MAASRKRQSHAQRVANYLRKHPGADRAAARGHGAHLRAPGLSEYGERKRRAAQHIGGGGAGLTPTERAAIRAAYVARARIISTRAREYGYDIPSNPIEWVRQANEDIESHWRHYTYDQFLAVWGAMEEEDTAKLFFNYGDPHSRDPVRTVQQNFIEDMNQTYGLRLSDDMQWLKLLLYSNKKKGRKAA